MVRFLAGVLGFILMVVAVLGFMPEFNEGGKILGFFAINSISNIVHLATGVIALMCAMDSSKSSIIFFLIAGAFYGIAAILGFYDRTITFFRFLAVDNVNNFFHALVAAIALYIGIFYLRKA